MITLNTHTTSEINQKATHLLFEQMGIVDTFKFLNQFTLGSGDYTKERAELLKELTLDEIITDIKENRKLK
jgi:hypothetical protein